MRLHLNSEILWSVFRHRVQTPEMPSTRAQNRSPKIPDANPIIVCLGGQNTEYNLNYIMAFISAF
jgi:hypothetical protein